MLRALAALAVLASLGLGVVNYLEIQKLKEVQLAQADSKARVEQIEALVKQGEEAVAKAQKLEAAGKRPEARAEWKKATQAFAEAERLANEPTLSGDASLAKAQSTVEEWKKKVSNWIRGKREAN